MPNDVMNLATIFRKLSLDILKKLIPIVLPQLEPDKWDNATGGLTSSKGLIHFSFNHYRPNKSMIGLKPHRDFGYISLLFINKDGLFAKVEEQWIPIQPKKGYLIVNFGKAFEILVNNKNKLKACWHYVEKISEEKHGGDRISFLLCTDNNLSSPVQKFNLNGDLEIVYSDYQTFLDESFFDAYQETDLL